MQSCDWSAAFVFVDSEESHTSDNGFSIDTTHATVWQWKQSMYSLEAIGNGSLFRFPLILIESFPLPAITIGCFIVILKNKNHPVVG